jgi:hypothetical protein
MDIAQWLQSTIEATQRPPSLHCDRPGPAVNSDEAHRRAHAVEPPSILSRRRSRTSDSSIVELGPPHRHIGRENLTDSRARDRERAVSPEVEVDETPDPYKRKPRRKTRPDRYETKAKEPKRRGEKRRGKKDGIERKGRKTSTKKSKDKAESALVSNYHAKNVPRDRLTVRLTRRWQLRPCRSSNPNSCSHVRISASSRKDARLRLSELEEVRIVNTPRRKRG